MARPSKSSCGCDPGEASADDDEPRRLVPMHPRLEGFIVGLGHEVDDQQAKCWGNYIVYVISPLPGRAQNSPHRDPCWGVPAPDPAPASA